MEENLEGFNNWIESAVYKYGHRAFNLVGAPTSYLQYKGPTLLESMSYMKEKKCGAEFGCVCIPERHTKKGNESTNMVNKIEHGAEWFISQGVYSSAPLIKLIHDYAFLCKQKGKYSIINHWLLCYAMLLYYAVTPTDQLICFPFHCTSFHDRYSSKKASTHVRTLWSIEDDGLH